MHAEHMGEQIKKPKSTSMIKAANRFIQTAEDKKKRVNKE